MEIFYHFPKNVFPNNVFPNKIFPESRNPENNPPELLDPDNYRTFPMNDLLECVVSRKINNPKIYFPEKYRILGRCRICSTYLTVARRVYLVCDLF